MMLPQLMVSLSMIYSIENSNSIVNNMDLIMVQ